MPKQLIRALIVLLGLAPLPALAAGTFFWTCESETLGASDYSAGDTTATASGSISISSSSPLKGSNSCLTAGAGDYYIFAPASIVATGEGSVGLLVRYDTAVPTGSVVGIPFTARDSADNDSAGFSSAVDEVRQTLRQDGSGATTITTTTVNLAPATTYFFITSWDIANDRRRVAAYDSSCALIQEITDTSTDLAANQPTNFDQIRIGNSTSHANPIMVDSVVVASDYDDPVIDACAWTSFYPTFSTAPAAGTHTSTSLQITYTPDQPGTAYGVACPNGATATHAQVVAGTCSSGAALATFTEVGVAGVGESELLNGLTASTTYDTYFAYVNTLGGNATASASLPDQTTAGAGGISFSNGPTVVAATNGYTIGGTVICTGTCTVEAVACAPGDAAPSNAELEAGQCGGGNAALINASETWVTTVANDFLLTAANLPPRLDVYVAGTDGTNDTAVSPFADSDRSPRSGYALVALTSVASTGICDLDSYFTPDCAIGDVFEYEDDTNQDADCNVSIEPDSDVVYTPVAAGDCDLKHTFEISYEDVSSATSGLFTAPSVGNFTTDDLVCLNNTSPSVLAEPDAPIALLEDSAMTPIDLNDYLTDDDDDALTFTETGATSLPAGTSLGGTGNATWSGTPSTEDEAGTVIEITATDECGATATVEITVHVVNTWTVPSCNAMSASECEDAVVAVAPWRVDDPNVSIGGYVCGSGQAFLTIAEQTPAAGGQASAYEEISVSIVAAIVPDLTGMTREEAIAAIEAICP